MKAMITPEYPAKKIESPVAFSTNTPQLYFEAAEKPHRKPEGIAGRVLTEWVTVGFYPARRVINLDDKPGLETALLSEQAFRRLWDTPEEDEAWRHLQEET